MSDPPPKYPGLPLWVKVHALLLAMLAAAIFGMILLGHVGGGHGPARHGGHGPAEHEGAER